MTNAQPTPFTNFTITAEDYANALRLHARRHWAVNLAPKLFVAALLIAAVLVMVLSGFDRTWTIIGICWLCVGIGMPLLAYKVILPRRARSIYAKQKTMQHPVSASWTDEAYSASTAHISGTTLWNDYYGWSADEKMVILMQSQVLFQMIPRHALSDEQAASLLDTIERSGLRKL
ncbi:YcxB family protein [Paracoccus caeni]|uniref:YcxB family protein n=1 Tax=Paracoccus caeni TaxID=657651 RepID=A0A934VUM8_9RHOB|nr:YcxB family protein [Paracoccus caeni]MBK4215986.1 YcxB family protein [Paracoccus caeni]